MILGLGLTVDPIKQRGGILLTLPNLENYDTAKSSLHHNNVYLRVHKLINIMLEGNDGTPISLEDFLPNLESSQNPPEYCSFKLGLFPRLISHGRYHGYIKPAEDTIGA